MVNKSILHTRIAIHWHSLDDVTSRLRLRGRLVHASLTFTRWRDQSPAWDRTLWVYPSLLLLILKLTMDSCSQRRHDEHAHPFAKSLYPLADYTVKQAVMTTSQSHACAILSFCSLTWAACTYFNRSVIILMCSCSSCRRCTTLLTCH